jgi:hypothetical protein
MSFVRVGVWWVRGKGTLLSTDTGGNTMEGTMKEIWTYRDASSWSDASITGYDVEATDGSIGKIDELSAEAGSSYVVVDTGFWIFGKKRLVPAGVIDRVDRQNEKVFVRMTKEQVKNAPDFDDTHRQRRGKEYDTYYETYVR